MNDRDKKAVIIGGLILACSCVYGYKKIAQPAPAQRKTSPYAPRPGLVDAAFRFEIGHKIYYPEGKICGVITKYQVKNEGGKPCVEILLDNSDGVTTLLPHSEINKGNKWWIDGEMSY